MPLYTTDEGGSVFVSSDSWPSNGPTPGLTKAQIAEAKAQGVRPTRKGGFGYMRGPDDALVEYAGNHPAERFNHVHMFHEDPFCAQLWYQTHLNAPVYAGRTSQTPLTEATCTVPRGPDRSWPALEVGGMFRSPSAAVVFGDVALPVQHAPGRSAAGELPAVTSTTTSRSASGISTPGSPSYAARVCASSTLRTSWAPPAR